MIEELMLASPKRVKKHMAFQMVLSLFKDDFPWLYDAGMDVIKTLKTSKGVESKDKAVNEFMELVDFSFEHPVMREMTIIDKEQYMMLRELPYMLRHSIDYKG